MHLPIFIHNRWGKQVYQTHSLQILGWDGEVQGVYANEGTYIWQLEFGYIEADTIIRQSTLGSVVLFR